MNENIAFIGEIPVAFPIAFPTLIDEHQVYTRLFSNSGNVYQLVRLLSENEIGTRVYVGTQLGANFNVVIKYCRRSMINQTIENVQENPLNEIAALQMLNENGDHRPNIIKLIEWFHDANYLYIVTEYHSNGDLFKNIKDSVASIEPQARFWFKQALIGLSYIHSRGIWHRDLSLENLVLSNDRRVVIIDFGLSLRLPNHPLIPPQGRFGKKNYMAPEILLNRDPLNGFKADIWSMGIILYMLLTKRPPFRIASPVDPNYRMLILEGRLAEHLAMRTIPLSRQVVDLLPRILQRDPAQRLPIDDILNDEWFAL